MSHVVVVTVDHNSQSHLLFVLLKPELTDDISIRLLVLEVNVTRVAGGARQTRFQKCSIAVIKKHLHSIDSHITAVSKLCVSLWRKKLTFTGRTGQLPLMHPIKCCLLFSVRTLGQKKPKSSDGKCVFQTAAEPLTHWDSHALDSVLLSD